MRKIRRIEPEPQAIKPRKRVCAYARVSSGKDAMMHSLSAQVSYYSSYIQRHCDWEYCGVYADEAVTGTKDSRVEFIRMLADCKAGKIDLVITKSISRFARNTVTLLETVRELKALGVGIYFEEQGIDSMSSDGELMLTILASYAQEESRSVSENVLWRIRERFRQGEPVGLFTMFGYRYENGAFIIDDKTAEVVRMVFADYIAGHGTKRIADKLRAMDVPTVYGGKWTANRVCQLVRNEKYAGNSLLQKRYTADHLSKLRRHNKGELPQYYAEDTHPAIIDIETFERAQEIMESRRRHDTVYSDRYLFSSKIVCGKCGKAYKRKVCHGVVAWQCSTYLVEGADACPSVKIDERIVRAKAAEAMGADSFDEGAFAESIERIVVPEPYKLAFVFTSGGEVILDWKPRSRSESWTEGMRAAARARRMETMRNG
jgi:DNA invertase Pin-like site-specific DNA recombinase